MALTIHTTHWQQHHHELGYIRTAVFIDEQCVSAADEWDGLDEQATHFLVLSPTGDPIGCARLLRETFEGNRLFHIGRVAILKAYRAQGIGHHLMEYVIDYCKKAEPHTDIYLHAQIIRRQFYETLGFRTSGTEFMDAGIPHISMYLAT